MTHHLDPLTRLILHSVLTLTEEHHAMSAELDALKAAYEDLKPVVDQAIATIDELTAKVNGTVAADPADAPAAVAITTDLAGLSQSLRDALARAPISSTM